MSSEVSGPSRQSYIPHRDAEKTRQEQAGKLGDHSIESAPRGPTGLPLDDHPGGSSEHGNVDKTGYFNFNCCNRKSATTVLKWVAVAAAVTALVGGALAGLVGALVYSGVLSVALSGLGVMSSEVALYTMISGLGVSLLTAIIGGALYALPKGDKKVSEEGSQTKSETTPEADELGEL